ncbi:MAG: hydroxymethylglutaryl-CoA synthase [Chloroflexi bacterium]|nr:hydroxymethylglutaryl-CoA synthase [Chloroflexota bacterium]
MMRPLRSVGLVGYGAYIPRYRLPASEISRIWGGDEEGTVAFKSVPGLDEDTVTIAIEAARNAVARARIDPVLLRAVWIGSESHPYAVKPSSTVVAEALGVGNACLAADLQFACKAGTEALQAGIALVGSGMAGYAMAIGADTAQGRPGDALEYTAAAGGAAYIVGPAEAGCATLEGSYSYVSDTPDFWRRPGQNYPRHGGRFTGEPGYFAHVLSSVRSLMEGLGRSASDYRYAVFHQPNPRFPERAARQLGFKSEQYSPGLLANEIGNAYAGSSLLGMSAVLDIAQPGDRILLVSFGSGAGSDAFSWLVTDTLPKRQSLAPTTRAYIERKTIIDYATYLRLRGQLVMH